jgi:hypothetical protein
MHILIDLIVSEEKIQGFFLWTTTEDGHKVMIIPHVNLWVRWDKLEAQVSLYRSPDINKSS